MRVFLHLRGMVYRLLRWFHAPATAMMVATPSLKRELESHGFRNVRIWSRGVDVDQFRPIEDAALPYPKPIFLYVGRIAVEKNVEAFLALDLPGTKVVIGDGPHDANVKRSFPQAKFLGPLGKASGPCTRGRRCVRIPEPHRHVRHRGDRGAGERPAGRRVSGYRSEGRGRRAPHRGSARGPWPRLHGRVEDFPRRLPQIRARLLVGKQRTPIPATSARSQLAAAAKLKWR